MAAIARNEQRRALVIAAVGFALVLVLFVGSRVLTGDDGDDAEITEPAPPTTAVPGAPGAPAPGDGEAADAPVVAIPELPDVTEIAELRDPFTAPLDQILFDRSQADFGTPGQDPGDAAPRSRLTLRSITTDEAGEPVAQVEVDGTLFEASEGEVFGPNNEFRAVSLDPESQCGLFLFGDESFTVCVDEEIPDK